MLEEVCPWLGVRWHACCPSTSTEAEKELPEEGGKNEKTFI
jgi:hypothetical protein